MGSFALVFGLLSVIWFLFVSSGWAIFFAAVSVVFGLLSSINAHGQQIERIKDSLALKIALGALAIMFVIISEPLARILIAKATMLDASLFADAVALMAYILTSLLIILGSSLIISVLAAKAIKDEWRKESVNALGRLVASFLTLVLVVAITFWWPGILLGLPAIVLELASFMDNGRASIVYSSDYHALPKECREAAAEAGIPDGKLYECVFQPVHCSNLPGDANIAFLPNGRVAVLEYMPISDLRNHIIPFKIELHGCDSDRLYRITAKEKIPITSGATTRDLTPNFFGKE